MRDTGLGLSSVVSGAVGSVAAVDGLRGLVDGLGGLVHGFALFLFDLTRRAFELPWKRLIYFDLWTEVVVMSASVTPFCLRPK